VVLVNEYARTKYAGERLALTRPGSLVVRTNIVGFRGWSRPTFVESMVRALRASDALTLFDDFFTSSIEVGACARAILDLVAADAAGTVNVASRSVTSKLEFVSLLAQAVDLEPSYTPGSVRQLAPRRAESAGLDVRRAEDLLGRPMPDARETVAALAGDARCAT
jgi:dTDP-4-dehydrorhamnose reductase